MTEGDDTTASWVRRAQGGSDHAFARLVDAHGQAVRNFLRRVCTHTDEADDLAQEAFLTAWTKLARLKDPSKFQSWVMGIAWRKAKTRTRSAARSRARETEWAEAGEANISRPDPDKAIALRQALAELAPDARAALALCLGTGLSHGEAADVLSLPLGTVKSHITRGRARLAEILGVHDE